MSKGEAPIVWRQVIIALGSNLESSAGTGEETLRAATERIAALEGIDRVVVSTTLRSRPAGPVQRQPDFHNAVLSAYTTLEPLSLLRKLQAIEREFGRVREGKDYVPGGSRTLDLDIIDYEGEVLDTEELTLPHPRALARDFVVVPLLEVSPHHVLANQQPVTRRFTEEDHLS
jgi:2-amino-4-hydroxy-6-hydroxymethyldihydropteridine diphosphokinase